MSGLWTSAGIKQLLAAWLGWNIVTINHKSSLNPHCQYNDAGDVTPVHFNNKISVTMLTCVQPCSGWSRAVCQTGGGWLSGAGAASHKSLSWSPVSTLLSTLCLQHQAGTRAGLCYQLNNLLYSGPITIKATNSLFSLNTFLTASVDKLYLMKRGDQTTTSCIKSWLSIHTLYFVYKIYGKVFCRNKLQLCVL